MHFCRTFTYQKVYDQHKQDVAAGPSTNEIVNIHIQNFIKDFVKAYLIAYLYFD